MKSLYPLVTVLVTVHFSTFLFYLKKDKINAYSAKGKIRNAHSLAEIEIKFKNVELVLQYLDCN